MTTFAPVTNFAYALIDGGITSVATAFSVVSGGSKFPLPSMDGNFNATIWNVTDYEFAHLDPNAEIVTVTGRTTNAFTVTRGAESTSAVAHNTTGKTYAIALTFTKASYDALGTAINARVTIDQTVGQTIGTTGARLTKLWATDITVTNAIVGDITGNAATATALETARTIGGVSFDGTANITVASAIAGFAVSGGTFSSSGNALFVTDALTVTASNKRIGVGTASPEYAYHHHTSGGGVYAVWGDLPFTGGIRFSNPTADASNGYNVISAIGNRDVATAQGLIIIGGIKSATEDTGTVAITEYRSYVGFSVPVASTTRPTHAWKNFNTMQMQLGAGGALTLGATAGTGTGALYAGAGTFTGKVQVGSTAPTASAGSALTINSSVTTGSAGSGSIIVQGEANKERIKIYSAGGSGGGGPLINLFSFRGSIASPSATQAGDLLAGVSGGGYGATAFSGNHYAFFQCAAENWTDSAMGTYTVFSSVPNGTTGAVARILIANDGTITFGSAFNIGTGALYAGTAVFTTASTSLTGISLTHSGVIAGGQDGVLINCTGANTNANSSALYVLQSNASSTQITARFTNLGSSHAVSLISAGGATLLSTQNTVTSTNFVKHFQWTKVGGGVVTLWISNGTDPNGVLSGTAGDVCFNCNSSLIKKCTGTTNWS